MGWTGLGKGHRRRQQPPNMTGLGKESAAGGKVPLGSGQSKGGLGCGSHSESRVTITVGKQRHREQGGGDGSCSLELLQGDFEERGANGREAGDDTKLAPYAAQ